MTHETRHVTHDRWGKVNLLSKLQLPSSYGLGVKVFGRALIAELQIEPNQNHLLTNLEGSIFAWLVVRSLFVTVTVTVTDDG